MAVPPPPPPPPPLPGGERTLLVRRGEGERREERLLEGERWRRPRGEGERVRRGLRSRVDPEVEVPVRELREPELLLSLDRLEDDWLDRPLLPRYMTAAALRAREAAFAHSLSTLLLSSDHPACVTTFHAHAHQMQTQVVRQSGGPPFGAIENGDNGRRVTWL